MFPLLEREAFDAHRHNRTDQYLNDVRGASRYKDFRVHVVVDAAGGQTYAGQVLTLATVNMLLRLFRNVSVSTNDSPLHPDLRRAGQRSLLERMGNEAWAADPFARPFGAPTGNPFVLHLGATVVGGPKPDLVAGSSGWTALAHRGPSSEILIDQAINPCGPALAASVATGETLKAALGFGDHLRLSEAALSTFDFSTGDRARMSVPGVPRLVQLGCALLVGGGSVGSNLAYLLANVPIEGTLTILDHDVVKGENLDRSLLFGVGDLGWPKAEVLVRWLQERTPARAFAASYNEYVMQEGRHRNSVDVVFPLANEQQVRWALANSVPPLQIYGTTRGDWGANLGRHIPLKDSCLGCRFGRDAEPVFECATGSIDEAPVPSFAGNDAALPFLSFAAATFALAELLKAQLPGYPFNHEFADLDFKGPLQTVAHHERRRQIGCACASVTRELFEHFNGTTLFAHLSLNGQGPIPL